MPAVAQVVAVGEQDAMLDACALLQRLGFSVRLVSADGDLTRAYVDRCLAVFRPEGDAAARDGIERYARSKHKPVYRDAGQLAGEIQARAKSPNGGGRGPQPRAEGVRLDQPHDRRPAPRRGPAGGGVQESPG